MNNLRTYILENAIKSWGNSATLQQDVMVSMYREQLAVENGSGIDETLAHDEKLFSLSLLPLHIPKNARAYAQQVAPLLREEHKPQISEIIEEQSATGESISDYFAYQLQRFNATEAEAINGTNIQSAC